MDEDLRDVLEEDAWAVASSDLRQEAIAAALSDVQGEHRFGPVRFQTCGPPEHLRVVASTVEETSGVEFCLVPGGWFCPGLDISHREALAGLMAKHEPQSFRPYGAAVETNICFTDGARVPVPPFLIARFPVTKALRGLDECLPTLRGFQVDGEPYLALEIDEFDGLTKRYGWQVPHALQLEWAIGAGSPDVFYWGDDLDYERMVDENANHSLLRLDDPGDLPWPTTTAHGLRGAVSIPQWCWIAEDGGKRLYVRGGAGFCAPWQGCGELLWMVNFMVVPSGALEEHRSAHALRPVISL